MKKSNQILLGALGAILFFSLAFQLSVHNYVREGKTTKIPTKIKLETRETAYFENITVQKRIKVLFHQNDTSKVRIEAPGYLIDSITTIVKNKELTLGLTIKLKKKDSIIIHINNPVLTNLKLSSKAHFETIGKVSGENLKLEFIEESSANLELLYESIKYTNTSKGEVIINGDINKINLTQFKKQHKKK